MRASLAFLTTAAALAAPALADDQWWTWPTTTKHWGWGYSKTSDCDTSTEWVPPPPPPTSTPCSESEASTSYSETTVTISITSCPGGCIGSQTVSLSTSILSIVAPTSTSAPPLSLTLAPTTSYTVSAAPTTYTTSSSSSTSSSSLLTFSTTTTGGAVATPTLTVPANDGMQSGWSFSAALVGAVGVVFAML